MGRRGGADADLALIGEAARAAGRMALARQDSLSYADIAAKPDATPVTSADLEADRFLREMLLRARPDYGWLSEESRDDPARLGRERAFVVDPIDGTRAFIAGRPDYVVSVAVVERGRPVCGALHHPAEDTLYAAQAGQGAARNGERLRVRDWPALAGGRLVCPARHLAAARWRTPWPDDMETTTRDSMAYRIILVARGDWNGALALTAKSDWDLAAADLILTEAGGAVTDLAGAALRYNGEDTRKPGVICGAPQFHAALLARLRDWRRDEAHGEAAG